MTAYTSAQARAPVEYWQLRPGTRRAADPEPTQVNWANQVPSASEAQLEAETRTSEFLRRLDASIREASADGWDGEHAVPVRQDAIDRAESVFRLLPESLPVPNVSVTPVGSIAFEWATGPQYQMTILLAEANQVAIASYLAGASAHRAFDIDTTGIPDVVLGVIADWARGSGNGDRA